MLRAAISTTLLLAPAGRLASLSAAEIADPPPRQVLRDVVLIRDTAEHPALNHYWVSFEYEPNPTASWLAIEGAGGGAVPGGQPGELLLPERHSTRYYAYKTTCDSGRRDNFIFLVLKSILAQHSKTVFGN